MLKFVIVLTLLSIPAVSFADLHTTDFFLATGMSKTEFARTVSVLKGTHPEMTDEMLFRSFDAYTVYLKKTVTVGSDPVSTNDMVASIIHVRNWLEAKGVPRGDPADLIYSEIVGAVTRYSKNLKDEDVGRLKKGEIVQGELDRLAGTLKLIKRKVLRMNFAPEPLGILTREVLLRLCQKDMVPPNARRK